MTHFSGTKFALLSVTDKTGLVPFARGLVEIGFTLLSTGGTARLLSEAGVPVTEVAAYTGSSEILGGRVKTLHPKVHGAILYDRANPEHERQVFQGGIGRIDVVVVNLYQFHDEAVAKRLPVEAAIEHIDIGGPTMLRAAAKNWQHVVPVIDPEDYEAVLSGLRRGEVAATERRSLAAKVFAAVSAYDSAIADYLSAGEAEDAPAWPKSWPLALRKVRDLRYGENPHQAAALYAADGARDGFASLQLLQGKEVSYNNILDLDAAAALVAEFDEPAVAVIKHTNPCGFASFESDLKTVVEKALACDPKSAFGGIIATNRRVDAKAAKAMTSLFIECVAAPEFSSEALEIFRAKPNVRVLSAPWTAARGYHEPHSLRHAQLRSVRGAVLAQAVDGGSFETSAWRPVTAKLPSQGELKDLRIAMIVAKHVKSNAIVFVKDGATVGIGAGQMSRIDAANIAVSKAKSEGRAIAGSVMASDAFFPFGDTVAFAAAQGCTAIVQPGGSKRDQESIDAADALGLAMVMTGERHFRH